MNRLPPLELIRSTHTFPGPYVFKAIGRTEGGFVSRVVAGVRQELDQETDPPYRFRQTAGGRHVSVTLEPVLETAEQVLAIYRRILETSGLVVML